MHEAKPMASSRFSKIPPNPTEAHKSGRGCHHNIGVALLLLQYPCHQNRPQNGGLHLILFGPLDRCVGNFVSQLAAPVVLGDMRSPCTLVVTVGFIVGIWVEGLKKVDKLMTQHLDPNLVANLEGQS